MTLQLNLKKLRNKDKLLATYWVLGYPNIPKSIEIMENLADNGADIVEIGFPYSDPIADGSVIQQAMYEALSEEIQIDTLWEAIETIKGKASPFVMTYGNILLRYGVDNFSKKAVKFGLEGIILPDIPPSLYPKELWQLNPSFIISPNTSEKRVSDLTKSSKSFCYFLSGLATTGGKQKFDPRLKRNLITARKTRVEVPFLVGFGISDRNGVNLVMDMGFDGVIIGSALLRNFKKGGEKSLDKGIAEIRATLDDY